MRLDGTTILLGLPRVRVREVERVADGTRVVHVETDDDSAAACPACGVLFSRARQRRTTSLRDVPYGEVPLVVRWHKVQFACRENACARKAFTEQIAELSAVRGWRAGCGGTSRGGSSGARRSAWPRVVW